MRRNRLKEDGGIAWRAATLLAVVLLAFATTISVAIWQTVRSVNAVEAERNRLAVAAAFVRERARVEALARSNNDWDDEVFEEDFGRVAPERSGGAPVRRIESESDFDEIWIRDSRGRLLLTVARDGSPEALHGPDDTETVTRLSAATRRSGLPQSVVVPHRGGLGVYATALLDARSDFVTELPGSAGGILVVHENISDGFLRDTAEMLQLGRLTLTASRKSMPNRVVVSSPGAAAPVSAAWSDHSSGMAVIAAELPVVMPLVLGFVVVIYFIARQLFSSFRYLSRQARIDWLSNLPNRWALQNAIRKAGRNGGTATLALIDLDSFKVINDYHGHSTGDQIIRHVGQRLRTLAPRDALVARLGGDEFAILLTGADGDARLEPVLSSFLDEMAAPFRAGPHAVQLGASVGTATQTGESQPGDLLRRADIAMYAAKRNGRMNVVRYDESMDRDAAADVALKDDLATAVAQGQLWLKYQPIVDARTGEIVAVEALARWTSDIHGVVSPGRFIPLAEKFGLMGPLSAQLFERACRDCASLPGIRLALNVSAAQIGRPDFPALIRGTLARTGLPPDRLEIEITETSLVRGGDRARAALEALSAMGIKLTLDDFGNGFASIGFLRQFPFDTLKIDRSIISESMRSAAARGVIVACIAMARALDMEVIAEGVETVEEADLMRAEGCRLLQGWLFCRAVPIEEIRARLQDQILAA